MANYSPHSISSRWIGADEYFDLLIGARFTPDLSIGIPFRIGLKVAECAPYPDRWRGDLNFSLNNHDYVSLTSIGLLMHTTRMSGSFHGIAEAGSLFPTLANLQCCA